MKLSHFTVFLGLAPGQYGKETFVIITANRERTGKDPVNDTALPGTGDSAEPSLLSGSRHRPGAKLWIKQEREALSSLQRRIHGQKGIYLLPPPLTQGTHLHYLAGWGFLVGWMSMACLQGPLFMPLSSAYSLLAFMDLFSSLLLT